MPSADYFRPNLRKTSLQIDPKLWEEWIQFTVRKTGHTHAVSRLTEDALRSYMEHDPDGKKA